MIIGVHSKSAFKRERSRVDEYVYQLIKHFAMLDEATRHRFLLYTPFYHDTLYLPPNFIVRRFYTPFFWTKLFFSLKVWFDAPNVLFMPVNYFHFGAPLPSFTGLSLRCIRRCLRPRTSITCVKVPSALRGMQRRSSFRQTRSWRI